jgi:hypothetical protein
MVGKYVVDLSIPRGLNIGGKPLEVSLQKNHHLFYWKTKPKTNHFDIWLI